MMQCCNRSIVIGAVVAAGFLACAGANAQPGQRASDAQGSGWKPDMMMGPGMMRQGGLGFMCNPRAAGMAEWRLERMETTVRPTEPQRAALNTLKTASTKAAETIAAACSTNVPATSAERMALMEKRLEAMLQAVKTVRPAFDAFYNLLDNEQKARLDAGGPRRWSWHGWRWRWDEG